MHLLTNLLLTYLLAPYLSCISELVILFSLGAKMPGPIHLFCHELLWASVSPDMNRIMSHWIFALTAKILCTISKLHAAATEDKTTTTVSMLQ
jgi:hypothetical protein